MWSVIGQDRAVSLLQRSLATDSVAHAYLFTGPAHVGKMTLAVNLAQALNCAVAEPPCGACSSCQRIAAGKHADVQVIVLNDETSEENRAKIGVGQIEELQHSASLPPFEGKRKVFIIDGAEFFSSGAANRLLKTLEEPVGSVVFILLTGNEELLPATVVSRCQRLELHPLTVNRVEEALVSRWSVESPKAKLLARLSRGCLGWAVIALDEGLLQQRAEHLEKWLGITHGGFEERFSYAAQLATQFNQKRGVVQERLDLWLEWWRDLLLAKVGLAEAVTNIDRLTDIVDMAARCSLSQIRAFIDSIQAAMGQLKLNVNPRLVLEVLMLSIPETEKHGGGSSAAQVEVKNG